MAVGTVRVVSALVLASESPRRREILRSYGIDVEVVPSEYRELDLPGMKPIELARAHARGKVLDVLPRRRDKLIVGADTVVELDGVSFGKPSDATDAARILRTLSGRTHLVHTAFAVADRGELIERTSSTSVTFYGLTSAEIDGYIATGDPFDKAGAYGIQGRGATLVEQIEGDFYTVMGFPLGLFVRTLGRHGVELRPGPP
jgi:septum formation protein